MDQKYKPNYQEIIFNNQSQDKKTNDDIDHKYRVDKNYDNGGRKRDSFSFNKSFI